MNISIDKKEENIYLNISPIFPNKDKFKSITSYTNSAI